MLSLKRSKKGQTKQYGKLFNNNHSTPVKYHRKNADPIPIWPRKGQVGNLDFCPCKVIKSHPTLCGVLSEKVKLGWVIISPPILWCQWTPGRVLYSHTSWGVFYLRNREIMNGELLYLSGSNRWFLLVSGQSIVREIQLKKKFK